MASAPIPTCRGCGEKFTTRRKKNETGYCGDCIWNSNFPEEEHCKAPTRSGTPCRKLGREKYGGHCSAHRKD